MPPTHIRAVFAKQNRYKNQTLRGFIEKQDTVETYHTNPKAFTHRPTLDFPKMVYLLLSNMTKTIVNCQLLTRFWWVL